MKIIIDIPQEFEQDFINNQFEEAFQRLMADAHCIAGNYEKETASMLINAFRESKEYDLENVIHKLEDRKQLHERLIEYEQRMGTVTEEFQHRKAVSTLEEVIGIVKNIEVEIEKKDAEGEQEM